MSGPAFKTIVQAKDKADVRDAMLELRARGLSYPAIAGALDVFWGIRLSGENVRGELRRMGEPKNPRKASNVRVAA